MMATTLGPLKYTLLSAFRRALIYLQTPWPVTAAAHARDETHPAPGDPEAAPAPLAGRCMPPESTPSSYRWMATHRFVPSGPGRQCADCGEIWPKPREEGS